MIDVKVSLTGSHQLDLPTLRARIEQRVQHYAGRYPQLNLAQHYRWLNPTHAHGQYRGGKGDVVLSAGEVRIELDLPFFARLYRGRIEEFVAREMRELTAPAPAARGHEGDAT